LDQQPLFAPQVLKELSAHDWPGNVRELRNYVERAVIMGVPNSIRGSTLPPLPLPDTAGSDDSPTWTEQELNEPFKTAKERLLSRFERTYLARLLESNDGNISRAARQAKLDRMYLSRLLERHNLKSKSSEVG